MGALRASGGASEELIRQTHQGLRRLPDGGAVGSSVVTSLAPVVTSLDAVFTGRLQPLGPKGLPSGILKTPVSGMVQIGVTGIEGDEQGDRRVHGGPEKAVHYYPAASYATLAAHRPELAPVLVPGSLGENLSGGLTEADVCIGDVYRVGTAELEVSQLRRPCWKIEARFEAEGLIEVVNRTGCTGWYFRVRTPGECGVGDEVDLLERPSPGLTLARYHAAEMNQDAEAAELRLLAVAPALNKNWASRLLARAEFLESAE